jgi:antitoxin (DNA-binding transcriptional repressor) of toxin-antitoxin stability system
VVTERNRPVATLAPLVGEPGSPLANLIAEGRAQAPVRPGSIPAAVGIVLSRPAALSAALDETRGER